MPALAVPLVYSPGEEYRSTTTSTRYGQWPIIFFTLKGTLDEIKGTGAGTGAYSCRDSIEALRGDNHVTTFDHNRLSDFLQNQNQTASDKAGTRSVRPRSDSVALRKAIKSRRHLRPIASRQWRRLYKL
jgi:hypothetical protein